MHSLGVIAGLLALIALAFGPRAASVVAAVVVICGGLFYGWMVFMVVTGRV